MEDTPACLSTELCGHANHSVASPLDFWCLWQCSVWHLAASAASMCACIRPCCSWTLSPKLLGRTGLHGQIRAHAILCSSDCDLGVRFAARSCFVCSIAKEEYGTEKHKLTDSQVLQSGFTDGCFLCGVNWNILDCQLSSLKFSDFGSC